MKALSIRQPWAFAITHGYKPVENRTWPTRYRGPILVHAGVKEEKDDVDYVLGLIAQQTDTPLYVIRRRYKNHGACGGIVGRATLSDCVTHLDSIWFNGPFGFVLTDPKWCSLIPCRGALGLFDVPPDTLDAAATTGLIAK